MRRNATWESGLEAVVQAVCTSVLQPLGAEIAAAEAERNATNATRTFPRLVPDGRATVSVEAGVGVAALAADEKVGVAAGASPRSPPPSATAAAATAIRRPVTLGTW
jgi:hypothetical protein